MLKIWTKHEPVQQYIPAFWIVLKDVMSCFISVKVLWTQWLLNLAFFQDNLDVSVFLSLMRRGEGTCCGTLCSHNSSATKAPWFGQTCGLGLGPLTSISISPFFTHLGMLASALYITNWTSSCCCCNLSLSSSVCIYPKLKFVSSLIHICSLWYRLF